MPARPIAVSMRVTEAAGYDEPRDSISHDWIRFLARHNCVPLLIPNLLEDVEAFFHRFQPQAVVLTGGNSVCTSTANGDDAAEASNARLRDEQERRILDYCSRTGLPVMGVCRGMQFLNHYYGGRIEADLAAVDRSTQHVASSHSVDLSRVAIAEMAGSSTIEVNSFHDQGVLRDEVGDDLEPFATKGDVVEGLIHRRLPQLAVQWHPERPAAPAKLDDRLFDAMFSGYQVLR